MHHRLARLEPVLALAFLLTGMVAAEAKRKPHPEPLMESDKPDAKEKAEHLQVLQSGDGRGYYAYYQHRKFDAVVDRDGAVLIRMKDDQGNYVQTPWKIHPGIYTIWNKLIGYHKNGRPITKWFRRYMTKVEKADRPTTRPSDLRIEAELMEGVRFIRRVKFDDNTIRVWSGYDCDNEEYPSRYRFSIKIEQCMSFKPEVPQGEREKALEGYSVTVEGAKKKQTIPFAKSRDFTVGRAEEMRVTGPWKERTFVVDTYDPIMRTHKYRGKCPYEGFWARIYVPNDSRNTGDQVEVKYTIE